jgi:hypothetical protein
LWGLWTDIKMSTLSFRKKSTITMPLYDIEYITPLTIGDQEKLAIALTELHAKRFKTPAAFINVRYTDVSEQVVSIT